MPNFTQFAQVAGSTPGESYKEKLHFPSPVVDSVILKMTRLEISPMCNTDTKGKQHHLTLL